MCGLWAIFARASVAEKVHMDSMINLLDLVIIEFVGRLELPICCSIPDIGINSPPL